METKISLQNWIVYDAKLNGILEFNNQTIKGYLLEHNYKLIGRYITVPLFGKFWCDFLINSDYFEKE